MLVLEDLSGVTVVAATALVTGQNARAEIDGGMTADAGDTSETVAKVEELTPGARPSARSRRRPRLECDTGAAGACPISLA